MFIRHSRSIEPALVGKRPDLLSRPWRTFETSVQDLVAWAYVGGRAFAASEFDHDTPLRAGEKSTRNSARWRGAQLVVLDVDDAPNLSLADLIADPCVQKYAAAVVPSSSYSHERVKAHVLFVLSQYVDDATRYREIGHWIASQCGFPVDKATLSPFQAIFGTLYTHPSLTSHRRALDDGLVWLNPSPVVVSVPLALAARIASGDYRPDGAPTERATVQDTSPDSEEDINRRVAAHLSASPAKRLSVTLEALSYALKDWGEAPRDERLPLLMAAHAACSDTAVRDAFLAHSSPRWDASAQKATLPAWWAAHSARRGGYTAATLFYAARRNGWLAYSSVELSNATEIYAPEVSDWLLNTPDLPSRLLLKSPTGTGKTQAAIALLKQIQAKKALFFAPSIKLCIALSRALTRAGVENTLYIENNKTKDSATLREADVLVTTLQTFGVKLLASGVDVASYDLVVIDESDELFSAFVRSGIGGKLTTASHVTKEQARFGIDTLYQVFQKASRVLLLDGTATDLSRFMMEHLSPADMRKGVYFNTFTREKADVTVYTQLNALRQDIMTSVLLGQRVVVACDTKAEAALIETLLLATDTCTHDEILRITGDTIADPRVGEFFADVEAGAASYPVIIYNSAMGSGVSIVHTQPDVVYLIATYLSPRKLLQMLNRYRRQSTVRAYIAPRESLYSDSVADRFERMQMVLAQESKLLGLPVSERVSLAQVITEASLIAATDEYDQQRSVRDFFVRLLREDGRRVDFVKGDGGAIEDTVQKVRELLRERRQGVFQTWRSAPPLARGATIPKDLGVEDVARGLLHGLVREEFGERIDTATTMDDAEIAELALHFKPYKRLIDRWLEPERATVSAVDDLQNPRRENTSLRLYMSRVELLGLLGTFLPALDAVMDDDMLSRKAKTFIESIKAREAAYDLMVSSHLSLASVLERGLSEVETARVLAGAILKAVGLSLKRKNGARTDGERRERVSYVDGTKRLFDYLYLRGKDVDAARAKLTHFNREAVLSNVESAQLASKRYRKLNLDDRREVLATLSILDNISFGDAVSLQLSRSF